MAGVYGEIDTHDDFQRVLQEARAIIAAMRELHPGNPIIEAIDAQLDRMQRVTAGGRTPTEDERKTVSVGLIAVRELDADRQDESGLLARKLFVLDVYFAEWPTDEQATHATDADYWARFGL